MIPILPIAQGELDRLAGRAKLLKEAGLSHSLKKASGSGKKRKKNGEATVAPVSETSQDGDKPDRAAKHEAAPPGANAGIPSGVIKDAATASLTAKVLEHEKERNKRRKLGMNENLKGLFSSGDVGQGARNGDFMTRGYTIPANARR